MPSLFGFIQERIARLFPARSFDGASGGRRWKNAAAMPVTIAAQLGARRTLAERARYYSANHPLAASGVEAWVSALVGTGIKPQSAHPDAAVRALINAKFEASTDHTDPEGAQDHYAQQALAVRRMVIDGECFALLENTTGGLCVRLIDAEQIDGALHRELPGGARITAGIEFTATGRRVAYWMFEDRPGLPTMRGYQAVRVSAQDVLHLYRLDTPGQVRGISWFAPVLLRLLEHDQSIDAQLTRQKLSAMLTGFVIDANTDAFSGENKGNGQLEVSLEPGTMQRLDPGQDVKFSDPANVGAEVLGFFTMTAREIAAGLGVPYETLTGDLSGVNYSSIRAGLVQFRRRVEAIQHHTVVHQFVRPIWRRFVTTEILRGRINAPGFERDPEAYLAATFYPPKQDWVDPAKDVDAELAAIAGGLKSRRQSVAERGMDLEVLDAEIAADARRATAMGLDFSATQKKGTLPDAGNV